MNEKKIAIFPGEDASPEVMTPTIELLEEMNLPLDFDYPMVNRGEVSEAVKSAIDLADTTFFGSTSGASTAVLFYLRWGKETYANVRPCHWLPGFQSPLADPQGIDFVIVRENLEDLYLGLEGDLEELAALNLYSSHAHASVANMAPGKFAIKAITAKGTERVVRYAFELAQKRNGQKKVTITSKYNMLSVSDGYFRDIALSVAEEYPEIECETFIIDDFLCRMISRPQRFDVIVMPNLYGDIMSDGAAGLIGGLGLAPSGCYGDDYAYFESAHGSAPDIAGEGIINPTATILSAAMMLDYLELSTAARSLRAAVSEVYARANCLTIDQGGSASTQAFFQEVRSSLFNG